MPSAPSLLADASDAFSLIERLIGDESIACFWKQRGRFVGAWTPTHYAEQEKRLRALNDDAQSGASMVPRENSARRSPAIITTAAWSSSARRSLHPALYYKGLLDACRRRGVAVCAEAASRNRADGAGWRVTTAAAQ